MRPVQHHTNTRVLGAPKGWEQGTLPCHALPISDMVQEGVRTLVSFWKPDADELARLNAGGLVALSVVGSNMPPVALLAWTEVGAGEVGHG